MSGLKINFTGRGQHSFNTWLVTIESGSKKRVKFQFNKPAIQKNSKYTFLFSVLGIYDRKLVDQNLFIYQFIL